MEIKDAIAQLKKLARVLVSATTNEKSEAQELRAKYEAAIAQKDEAIARLSTELLSLQAMVDPQNLVGLQEVIGELDSAIGGIQDLIETVNPTPIADMTVAVVDPEIEIDPIAITDGVDSASVLEESIVTLVGS